MSQVACEAKRPLCCEVAKLNDPPGGHLDDTLNHSLNDTINRPLNGPHNHLITSYCDIQGKVRGVIIKVAILIWSNMRPLSAGLKSCLINEQPPATLIALLITS